MEMVATTAERNDRARPRSDIGKDATESEGARCRSTLDALLITVIDSRTLQLDSLVRALRAEDVAFQVQGFTGIQEWSVAAGGRESSAILLGIGGKHGDAPDVVTDLQTLAREHPHIPVVVLGDIEEPSHIVGVLTLGARGYIPASVSLNVAIEAVRLVLAGGLFIPASSVIRSYQKHRVLEVAAADNVTRLLTKRQAAVADAIRQGKPNKVIAYELNLSESTVKVHVRDIMKKLKAGNRTEVAFKLTL